MNKMHNDDYQDGQTMDRSSEDGWTRPVRAGKRTYFFDVKSTRGGDYYLTITESKRRMDRDGGFSYDNHKIFLYKEDFEKFSEGLAEVVDYIQKNCPKPAYNGSEKAEGEKSYSDVDFEEL